MHYLIGQKFGRLTPIARMGASYRCLCDCGLETTTKTSHLVTGKTKSCGCLQREMREALARLKATPEEKRAKLRAYYAEHSEAAAKASQVYYEKNKDYIQEVQRVCRENKLTAEDRNRRARKAVERLNRKHRVRSGGKVSKGLFALLYFRQQGGCVYCGKNLDTGFHRDHIMPIALGGSNTDDNMQLLCPECNIAKGARYPNEYEDSIGFKRGGTT